MSQKYTGNTVVTADEQPAAGRVIDAGRKGGAVSSAPYSEAGPLAGRMFDATAALSESSSLRMFVPVIVFGVLAVLLLMAVWRFEPSATPQGMGQIAPSAAHPGSGNRDHGMRNVRTER